MNWKMLENGDEVIETRLCRVRCYALFGGTAQGFEVELLTEGAGWVQLCMSISSSSPRRVAKEAALVAVGWYLSDLSKMLAPETAGE